jgi:hypothetical protein
MIDCLILSRYLLNLILNHKESRCTENLYIAPQHRSLKNESIQTIIFIKPGPYIPFHVELQANSIKIVWRNIDKNGALLVLDIFFHVVSNFHT